MNGPLRLLREMERPLEIIAADARAGVVLAQTKARWTTPSATYQHEDEGSELSDATDYERAVAALVRAHEVALESLEDFVSKHCAVDESEMEAGDEEVIR